MKDNDADNPTIYNLFLENNEYYLHSILNSRRAHIAFRTSPRCRKLYRKYLDSGSLPVKERNLACSKVLNAYEHSLFYKLFFLKNCIADDIQFRHAFSKGRMEIDHSDKHHRDYYSVAVILKNEARNIREYILFYQATGADRIYLYDNDSDDNLLEVIDPFIRSGFVVYRKWPGRWPKKSLQTSAYRDAVRKAKKRTTWLAIIDADEFLFSPKGKMPDQLKAYESYPGIGVNWITFGPNGHDRRPEGLIMDNYTTAIEYGNTINHHIKSIVQPKKVLSVYHTHFPIYRKNAFAVDENYRFIDNYSSYISKAGRAFTEDNHRDIFRINHYVTKSLEDLEIKCARGYADGVDNAVFEEQLRMFECPLVSDYEIKPFADIVRSRIDQ